MYQRSFHPSPWAALLAALLASLIGITTAHAKHGSSPMEITMPAGYPKAFQAMGVVFDIDAATVSINGTRYTLAIDLVVHSPTSSDASRFELREGVEVGFSYSAGTNNRLVISEIWILPPGTYRPS